MRSRCFYIDGHCLTKGELGCKRHPETGCAVKVLMQLKEKGQDFQSIAPGPLTRYASPSG